MKVIPGEIPIRLLDVLDGEEIDVTRDGQPIARIIPIDGADQGPMYGRIEILGDIVSPFT